MYSFCRDQSHKEICVLNPSTSVGGTTDPVDNWDLLSILPDRLRICWLGTIFPTHPDGSPESDRSLDVLLTPGHADDDLCLLDRQNRFILTGDTFYLGRLFVQGEPSSLKSYAASAARRATFAGEIDRVLPAHSTTLLKPLFLTRLDEAFQSIIDGNVMSRELEENRSEFEFGGFSVVVPNIATRALIEN